MTKVAKAFSVFSTSVPENSGSDALFKSTRFEACFGEIQIQLRYLERGFAVRQGLRFPSNQ
jgi:hypothetical protein